MRDLAGNLRRFRTASPGRLGFAAFVALAVLLESAVPAGFMPGSHGPGSPLIVVCPAGLNPAALAASGAGSHHHHHQSQPDDTGEHPPQATKPVCPLGGVFDSAAVLPAWSVPPVALPLGMGRARHRTASPRRTAPPIYFSRAPPARLELTRHI